MRIAYFDCFNGVAGDMILGALLDAGLSLDALRDALQSLPVSGFDVSAKRVTRHGLAAMHCHVALDAAAAQPHRHLADIRKILTEEHLSKPVAARAVRVFERLAEAEAQAHGTTVDQVHFHEVGAVDAIVDIAGTCWALDALKIDRVVCSPIPMGSGTIRCAHGVMPVPAPAVAHLMKRIPTAATDEPGELATPTGVALMATVAERFSALPDMTIERVGVGAGSREGETRPNILRVMIGRSDHDVRRDRIVVLEANIDDATPETLGYVLQRLLDEGALDAYCVPIHMKKGRPGVMLCALVSPPRRAACEAVIFRETTTFGIRRTRADRSKLDRSTETVATGFGEIRVKVGRYEGRIVTVSPEYDDCERAARDSNVALRTVMENARDAFWKSRTEGPDQVQPDA